MAPGRAQVAPDTRKITLAALPLYDEIVRTEWKKKFPVLVSIISPDTSDATDIDMVAVLDMSASMTKERVQNVKEAMLAVIKDLGPRDRFSMLPFSSEVQCRSELMEMSLTGKEAATSMVHNLVAGGESDTGAALQQAAKILEDRKMHEGSNRECLIVFISAGKDDSVYRKPINQGFPVHTIGLDIEHDYKVMRHIAHKTCGTYNYIHRDMGNMGSTLTNLVKTQRSVTAKNAEIKLHTHDGVRISSIASGGHKNSVTSKQSGVIQVNRLYASQGSDFIVYLQVDEGKKLSFMERITSGGSSKMKLMTVSATNEGVPVDEVHVSVKRTEKRSGASCCPLVAAALYRLALLMSISVLAEKPTADGLEKIRKKYLTSEQYRMYSKSRFEKDISEMQKGILDTNKHKMEGLPYMLSWLSSHNWQRATAKGSPHMSGNFKPTSTMGQQQQKQQQQEQQTMFIQTLLLLLPCAISALFILLVAVLFGLHTGILNMRQSQHLRMLSITGTTVINHVMEYLYSAVMYSTILGAFSGFIPSGITSSIPLLQQKAEGRLDKEKREHWCSGAPSPLYNKTPYNPELGQCLQDIQGFTNTSLPEGSNIAANPKTCGGTAGMSTGKITVQGGLVVAC